LLTPKLTRPIVMQFESKLKRATVASKDSAGIWSHPKHEETSVKGKRENHTMSGVAVDVVWVFKLYTPTLRCFQHALFNFIKGYFYLNLPLVENLVIAQFYVISKSCLMCFNSPTPRRLSLSCGLQFLDTCTEQIFATTNSLRRTYIPLPSQRQPICMVTIILSFTDFKLN